MYFWSGWVTTLKKVLSGTMAAPKSGGMHCCVVSCKSNYYNKKNMKVYFFRFPKPKNGCEQERQVYLEK